MNLKPPRLPRLTANPAEDLSRLVGVLQQLLQDMTAQINRLAEGRMVARYQAQDNPPVNVEYAVGDFVWNKTPAKQGTAGSRYIILGWVITVDGPATAGSYEEVRVLTGD